MAFSFWILCETNNAGTKQSSVAIQYLIRDLYSSMALLGSSQILQVHLATPVWGSRIHCAFVNGPLEFVKIGLVLDWSRKIWRFFLNCLEVLGAAGYFQTPDRTCTLVIQVSTWIELNSILSGVTCVQKRYCSSNSTCPVRTWWI